MTHSSATISTVLVTWLFFKLSINFDSITNSHCISIAAWSFADVDEDTHATRECKWYPRLLLSTYHYICTANDKSTKFFPSRKSSSRCWDRLCMQNNTAYAIRELGFHVRHPATVAHRCKINFTKRIVLICVCQKSSIRPDVIQPQLLVHTAMGRCTFCKVQQHIHKNPGLIAKTAWSRNYCGSKDYNKAKLISCHRRSQGGLEGYAPFK